MRNNNLFGYVLLVPLLVVLTMQVQAQTSIKVEIGNKLPEVGPVDATDPVELMRGELIPVWCNATISDLNGEQSITNVYSVLFNPATSSSEQTDSQKSHYSPVESVGESTSAITRKVNFMFEVHHNANPGLWTCRIIAVDRHGGQGQNETNITIHAPEPTCDDGYANQNETDIDCGGPCSPCSCLDGMKNYGEEGIDCGGSCPACSITPSKLKISAPTYVIQNEKASIDVTDDEGNKLFSLLRIRKPSQPLEILRTDDMGHAEVSADSFGIMNIMAVKRGYLPAEANVIVVKRVSNLVKIFSIILIILILILINNKRKKNKEETIPKETKD